MRQCEWCGHEHERTALCSKRPKWSRRGFLALFGAGVVGAALGNCGEFRPDHNGECLNCDEWADAHPEWRVTRIEGGQGRLWIATGAVPATAQWTYVGDVASVSYSARNHD